MGVGELVYPLALESMVGPSGGAIPTVMICSRFSSARSKLVAISLLFCSMLGSRAMTLGLMILG